MLKFKIFCVFGWGVRIEMEAWAKAWSEEASKDYILGVEGAVQFALEKYKSGNTESADVELHILAVDTAVKCNGWSTFKY